MVSVFPQIFFCMIPSALFMMATQDVSSRFREPTAKTILLGVLGVYCLGQLLVAFLFSCISDYCSLFWRYVWLLDFRVFWVPMVIS